MESQRSESIASINGPLYSIPPLSGFVQFVLASPDTEIAPQISESRKFPQAFLSMNTLSNWFIKTDLSSLVCTTTYKTLARSDISLMERWALQVAHSSHKRGITEIHPAGPIIDGISPFQVHGIHLDIMLQYLPNRWVLPTCSDISRYRIRPQNSG